MVYLLNKRLCKAMFMSNYQSNVAILQKLSISIVRSMNGLIKSVQFGIIHLRTYVHKIFQENSFLPPVRVNVKGKKCQLFGRFYVRIKRMTPFQLDCIQEIAFSKYLKLQSHGNLRGTSCFSSLKTEHSEKRFDEGLGKKMIESK